MKPITPQDIPSQKLEAIPPQVIEAFNHLIALSYFNGVAEFTQNEVVDLIRERMGIQVDGEFNRKWLNVEAVYEAAGWKVRYDKPDYTENYPTKFVFTKK